MRNREFSSKGNSGDGVAGRGRGYVGKSLRLDKIRGEQAAQDHVGVIEQVTRDGSEQNEKESIRKLLKNEKNVGSEKQVTVITDNRSAEKSLSPVDKILNRIKYRRSESKLGAKAEVGLVALRMEVLGTGGGGGVSIGKGGVQAGLEGELLGKVRGEASADISIGKEGGSFDGNITGTIGKDGKIATGNAGVDATIKWKEGAGLGADITGKIGKDGRIATGNAGVDATIKWKEGAGLGADITGKIGKDGRIATGNAGVDATIKWKEGAGLGADITGKIGKDGRIATGNAGVDATIKWKEGAGLGMDITGKIGKDGKIATGNAGVDASIDRDGARLGMDITGKIGKDGEIATGNAGMDASIDRDGARLGMDITGKIGKDGKIATGYAGADASIDKEGARLGGKLEGKVGGKTLGKIEMGMGISWKDRYGPHLKMKGELLGFGLKIDGGAFYDKHKNSFSVRGVLTVKVFGKDIDIGGELPIWKGRPRGTMVVTDNWNKPTTGYIKDREKSNDWGKGYNSSRSSLGSTTSSNRTEVSPKPQLLDELLF